MHAEQIPKNKDSELAFETVVQLDETVLEALDTVKLHRYVTVASRDERNAVPDEDRHDADDELVDRLGVEKGGNDLAAAHQPDVLTGPFAKSPNECGDVAVHEFHA